MRTGDDPNVIKPASDDAENVNRGDASSIEDKGRFLTLGE